MPSKKKPPALKRLKEYCEGEWTTERWRLSDTDLIDESDRGLVLLMVTRVDDVLKRRLREAMPNFNDDLDEALFGPLKPLSSFSSLIDVTHALGLLDKEHREKIHYLREIRNHCAHSDKHVSFAVKELRDAIELTVPNLLKPHWPTEAADQATARAKFLGITSFYIASILMNPDKALHAFEYFADEYYSQNDKSAPSPDKSR